MDLVSVSHLHTCASIRTKHMYTHTHTFTYVRTHRYVLTHMCTHTHTFTYVRTLRYVLTHMYTHTHTFTYVCAVGNCKSNLVRSVANADLKNDSEKEKEGRKVDAIKELPKKSLQKFASKGEWKRRGVVQCFKAFSRVSAKNDSYLGRTFPFKKWTNPGLIFCVFVLYLYKC